ncbi:DUF2059 domain-containing protein [Labilibaculum sp.]|uniref:DUF2059 domain-containing protein n=1 Tax=Labilibaculum sp. TaxID=2060723 RepID=UPI003565B818
MQNLKKSLILSMLILTSLISTAHKKGNSYNEDVLYLFQINGSEASYQQSMQAILTHFKNQESNVPQEYWNRTSEEFMHTSIQDLVKMLIPIYARNLSHEDILAMIEFYETDAGKRIAQKIPKISSESMQVGMNWGQAIAAKIKADIESKGFKIRLPFTP